MQLERYEMFKDIEGKDWVQVLRKREGFLGGAYRRYIRKYGHPIPRWLPIESWLLQLCAAYIAEGSVVPYALSFAIGAKEFQPALWQQVKDFFNITVTIKDEGSWKAVTVHSGLLASLFETWFGRGACNKRLPQWVFELDERHRRTLLSWLIHYDGWLQGENAYASYSTCSKTLAHQVKLLAHSVGMCAAIHKTSSDNQYALKITASPRYVMQKAGMRFHQIYTIERIPYRGVVYDLEVEAPHSYVVNDIIVHNSEPLGLNILEAMFYGKPVLAFFRGASPELIKDGVHGMLVQSMPQQDVENYAKAFKKFREMEFNSKVIQQHVRRNFNFMKHSAPKYEDFIKRIVEEWNEEKR